MKDSDIRHDVQGALERHASLDAPAIAVAVDAGVVTESMAAGSSALPTHH